MKRVIAYGLLTILAIASCRSYEKTSEITIKESTDAYQFVDSLVKKIEFTKLETTPECLIAQIDKIIHKDSIYIIYDKRVGRSIFLFNDTGHFLGKIKNVHIDDVVYNNGFLFVVSNNTAELHKFTVTGKHIETYKFPDIYPRSVAFISDKELVAYNNYSNDATNNLGRLCYYTLEDAKLIRTKTELPFKESMISGYIPIVPPSMFVETNTEIVINEFANDELFSVMKNSGESRILYDVKYTTAANGNRFDSSKFLRNGIEYLKSKKESAKSDYLYLNKRYLYFSYVNAGQDDFYILYDRLNNRVLHNARAFVLNKQMVQIPYQWFYDNNNDEVVLSYISAGRVNTDSLYRKSLQKLSPIFSEVNSLSNPILCKISLN